MGAFDGTNGPLLRAQFYVSGSFNNVETNDLRAVDIRRGRDRADQRFDAGSMTITLDNRSGIYDPDITTGPWVTSGVSNLKDGLRGRLVANWNSTDYVLFDGYLSTTDVDAGFDATVTMTFVDGLAKLGKVDAPQLKSTSFSGETTSTRVGRMLTIAKWPTGSSWRSLTGSVKVTGTTQGANILDIINECSLAEAGDFYLSRSGVATFVNLANKFSRPTQLLFDDSRAANTVEYDELKTTPGTLQVKNRGVVTRGKLKTQSFTYTPSSNKYGVKTNQIEAPVLLDGTALKLATYLARRDASPKTHVNAVRFQALALGALYPDLLETELLDQVTVKRTTVDGRNLTINSVVQGIEHTIRPETWECTFSLSPLNPYRITLP